MYEGGPDASFLHHIFSLAHCVTRTERKVILQQRCHGPRRSCTPATCRGHSRLSPRSSSWPIGRAHLAERRATPSATQRQSGKTHRLRQKAQHATVAHGSVKLSLRRRRSEGRGRGGEEAVHLVSLVNDDGVFGERFHHVEIFNSCCTGGKMKRGEGRRESGGGRFFQRTAELTLPVESHGRVPEVVAHLVPRHSLHRVCGFERIQHDAVLLHFSPVHLLHNTQGQSG